MSDPHPLWHQKLLLGGLALVISHYLMHFYLAASTELPFAKLAAILQFDTPRPFVYRVLTPWILGGLMRLGLEAQTAVVYFTWASFFACYYAFRLYLSDYLGKTRAAFGALSIFYVLPFVFIIPQPLNIWFPWDLPSVLFFICGLHFIYARQWLWWYVILILGTLNRETTGFLLPLLLMVPERSRLKIALTRPFLISAGLWLAIKIALTVYFADRPGAILVEWLHRDRDVSHLRENANLILDFTIWPYLLSTLGFAWVLAWMLRPRLRNDFLRHALWLSLPYACCVFLFANIGEQRIYGDLIGLVLTPVVVVALQTKSSGNSGRML